MFFITVVEHIFESLVECDERGESRPLLADWKVSEDGRVYTFHISKGVHFHDGSVLDSKVVKMNFDFPMKMDPRNLESRAFAGYPFLIDTPTVRLMIFKEVVDRMDTPDDHTVAFHLRRPYYLFPDLLCSPLFLMVSPEVLKHGDLDYVESHPIGTGLFKLKKVGFSEIHLIRNEDYWMEGVPEVDEVVFHAIPSVNAIVEDLLVGEVDIGILGISGVDRLSGKSVRFLRSSSWRADAILNLKKPYFQDAALRRTLNYATDKAELVSALNFADPDDHYPFDFEKATRILKTSEIPELHLCHSTFQGMRKLSAGLITMLKRVGMKVKRKERKPADCFEETSRGDFDIYPLIWFTYSGDGYWWLISLKLFGHDDPCLDCMIERIESERDEKVRRSLAGAAEELVYANAPWIFIFRNVSFYIAVSKSVEGKIELRGPGMLDLRKVRVNRR